MSKGPVKGEHYSYRDKIYKVVSVSRGTDEIVLEDISNREKFVVRYALLEKSYKRVFRVGVVAEWLERSTRSIYRYEQKGIIKKGRLYPTASGRSVRFYSLDDVYEMHEMIGQLHQGRPRADGRIVNNTLPDIGSLKIKLREKFN